MKRLMILLFILIFNSSYAWADSSWAVLRQTAIQTGEHIRRLQEAVKTVQYLQEQVRDTQGILQLAKDAAQGIDGVEFVTDFRNVVLETNDLISEVKGYINGDKSLADEWMGIFGSLDNWIEQSGEFFDSIQMSDSINSRGYTIADSYESVYKQNIQNAQKLIDHAKTVNEKGALKQIAEEMGHLIEMENNVIYLLSEILRGQSVEYSNANLKRKEDIIKFKQENKGVQRFIDLVSNDAFAL